MFQPKMNSITEENFIVFRPEKTKRVAVKEELCYRDSVREENELKCLVRDLSVKLT